MQELGFLIQGQGHNQGSEVKYFLCDYLKLAEAHCIKWSHRKVRQNDNLCPVQDSGSLAVFKVRARDQGHYKGPSGAFVTYCNISCCWL